MCGIIGALPLLGNELETDAEKFDLLLNKLKKRGPDHQTAIQCCNGYIGHARLSIQDLSVAANQPFVSDGWVITYNGEVYNYRELRKYLEGRGIVFGTNSDTEVLLEGFKLERLSFLDKIDGPFAFAILSPEKILWLARDKFGEKPLFFAIKNNAICFSSELNITASLSLKSDLIVSQRSLANLLKYSNINAPRTIWDGINCVEPYTLLEISLESAEVNVKKFGVLDGVSRDYDDELTASGFIDPREIRQSFIQSMKRRIETTDRPFATFLSGGIDSFLVTSAASELTDGRINAYCLGYPNHKHFDESELARESVSYLDNVDLRIIEASEEDLFSVASEFLETVSEPFCDASMIPTKFLASHVEETVIFGGDGADEIFAGYAPYQAVWLAAYLPRNIKALLGKVGQCLPKRQRRSAILNRLNLFFGNLGECSEQDFENWRSYCSNRDLEELGVGSSPDGFMDLGLKYNGCNSLLRFDFQYNLPSDMLRKVDLATMSESKEIRLPFLSDQLVRYALAAADLDHVDLFSRKKLLKKSFASTLPNALTRRTKKGFLMPVGDWLRNGRFKERLLDLAQNNTLVNQFAIEKFVHQHTSGRQDRATLLWSLLVLLSWHRNWCYKS